jgi:hypothetical protein
MGHFSRTSDTAPSDEATQNEECKHLHPHLPFQLLQEEQAVSKALHHSPERADMTRPPDITTTSASSLLTRLRSPKTFLKTKIYSPLSKVVTLAS